MTNIYIIVSKDSKWWRYL